VAVRGVVIDDEHRQVAKEDRRRREGRLRRVRLKPEAGGEDEATAPTRRAVHGDLSAHEGHQPGGDG
jgi:hypothetical protein